MTFQDPLLKELKGHLATLIGLGNGPLRDDHEIVFVLCHSLESVFLNGIIRHDDFSPWKTNCFQWFYQILKKYERNICLTFKSTFDEVLRDEKTKTHVGKTRLLIRLCLVRKCLHVPLQLYVENRDYEDKNLKISYKGNSILGNEILAQIFLSLLQLLSEQHFDLNVRNSSFLDESWQLSTTFTEQIVPCEALGITLGFPLGFPVIVKISDFSPISELGTVEIGDIIDEFNGKPIRNLYGSKISSLFKKCKSQPLQLTIIKGRDPETQNIFLPIIKLYRILGLNPGFPTNEEKYDMQNDIVNKSSQISNPGLKNNPFDNNRIEKAHEEQFLV